MKKELVVFKDEDYSTKKTVMILALLAIIGGVFGFLYETIFYRIDLGYFTKRGSTYGPWIPIYAIGSIFIMLLCYRFKKKPLLVFLISCVVTGIIEYLTGMFFYELFNLRLWDYNTEIWNFGNINGYICLRSVLFFGFSSLILIYFVTPLVKKLYEKVSDKKINLVTTILGGLFILDVILHFIFS